MTTVAGVDVTLGNFIGGCLPPRRGPGPGRDRPGHHRGAGRGGRGHPRPTSTPPWPPPGGPSTRWAGTSPAERSAALLAMAQVIEDNADELSALESVNVGKPISAMPEEIGFAVDNLRFFAGGARLLEGRAAGEYLTGYTSMLRRDPVGVVASIAPWNYPLMMAVWKFGPALAAGCTGRAEAERADAADHLEAGRARGRRSSRRACSTWSPGPATSVPPWSSTPGVDMVSLTGSVPTGKAIAEAASRTLKRVHLELGGKAPVIVFDDADLDAVVDGVETGRVRQRRSGLHRRLPRHRRARRSTTAWSTR